MKPNLIFAAAAALSLLLLNAGCDLTASRDLNALQGTWSGTVKGQSTPSKLIIQGKTMHFEGLEGGAWYDGTIALTGGNPKKLQATVTKSSVQQHNGKMAGFIYKVENGTLTLASLPPGQQAYPKSFDDPAARVFVLKKQGT